MSEHHNHEMHGYYTGDIHNQFVPEHYDPKNMVIFIVLTIVKAYFIVAFFMHLKHEKLSLAYCILLPFILIVYLIAMSLTEANYLNLWDLIFK